MAGDSGNPFNPFTQTQFQGWASFFGGNVQAPAPPPQSFFGAAQLGSAPTNGQYTGGWAYPDAWANFYAGKQGFQAPQNQDSPAGALAATHYARNVNNPNDANLLGWERIYGDPNTILARDQDWAKSLGSAPIGTPSNELTGGWENPAAWAAFYGGSQGFTAPENAGSPASALAAASQIAKTSSPQDNPALLGWVQDFGQPGSVLANTPNWAASLGSPQINASGQDIGQTNTQGWDSPLAWAAFYGGFQGYNNGPQFNTLQAAQNFAGVTDKNDPSLLGWELDYGNPQTVVSSILASPEYQNYLAQLAAYNAAIAAQQAAAAAAGAAPQTAPTNQAQYDAQVAAFNAQQAQIAAQNAQIASLVQQEQTLQARINQLQRTDPNGANAYIVQLQGIQAQLGQTQTQLNALSANPLYYPQPIGAQQTAPGFIPTGGTGGGGTQTPLSGPTGQAGSGIPPVPGFQSLVQPSTLSQARSLSGVQAQPRLLANGLTAITNRIGNNTYEFRSDGSVYVNGQLFENPVKGNVLSSWQMATMPGTGSHVNSFGSNNIAGAGGPALTFASGNQPGGVDPSVALYAYTNTTFAAAGTAGQTSGMGTSPLGVGGFPHAFFGLGGVEHPVGGQGADAGDVMNQAFSNFLFTYGVDAIPFLESATLAGYSPELAAPNSFDSGFVQMPPSGLDFNRNVDDFGRPIPNVGPPSPFFQGPDFGGMESTIAQVLGNLGTGWTPPVEPSPSTAFGDAFGNLFTPFNPTVAPPPEGPTGMGWIPPPSVPETSGINPNVTIDQIVGEHPELLQELEDLSGINPGVTLEQVIQSGQSGPSVPTMPGPGGQGLVPVPQTPFFQTFDPAQTGNFAFNPAALTGTSFVPDIFAAAAAIPWDISGEPPATIGENVGGLPQTQAQKAAQNLLEKVGNQRTVGGLLRALGVDTGPDSDFVKYGGNPNTAIDLNAPLQPQIDAIIGSLSTIARPTARQNIADAFAAAGVDVPNIQYAQQNPVFNVSGFPEVPTSNYTGAGEVRADPNAPRPPGFIPNVSGFTGPSLSVPAGAPVPPADIPAGNITEAWPGAGSGADWNPASAAQVIGETGPGTRLESGTVSIGEDPRAFPFLSGGMHASSGIPPGTYNIDFATGVGPQGASGWGGQVAPAIAGVTTDESGNNIAGPYLNAQGIEIHSLWGAAGSPTASGTLGCFGITQENWPAFSQALQAYAAENGPLTLTISPAENGTFSAVITPKNAGSGLNPGVSFDQVAGPQAMSFDVSGFEQGPVAPQMQAGYSYPSGSFSGGEGIQAGYNYPSGAFSGNFGSDMQAGYSYIPGLFSGEADPYNNLPPPADLTNQLGGETLDRAIAAQPARHWPWPTDEPGPGDASLSSIIAGANLFPSFDYTKLGSPPPSGRYIDERSPYGEFGYGGGFTPEAPQSIEPTFAAAGGLASSAGAVPGYGQYDPNTLGPYQPPIDVVTEPTFGTLRQEPTFAQQEPQSIWNTLGNLLAPWQPPAESQLNVNAPATSWDVSSLPQQMPEFQSDMGHQMGTIPGDMESGFAPAGELGHVGAELPLGQLPEALQAGYSYPSGTFGGTGGQSLAEAAAAGQYTQGMTPGLNPDVSVDQVVQGVDQGLDYSGAPYADMGAYYGSMPGIGEAWPGSGPALTEAQQFWANARAPLSFLANPQTDAEQRATDRLMSVLQVEAPYSEYGQNASLGTLDSIINRYMAAAYATGTTPSADDFYNFLTNNYSGWPRGGTQQPGGWGTGGAWRYYPGAATVGDPGVGGLNQVTGMGVAYDRPVNDAMRGVYGNLISQSINYGLQYALPVGGGIYLTQSGHYVTGNGRTVGSINYPAGLVTGDVLGELLPGQPGTYNVAAGYPHAGTSPGERLVSEQTPWLIQWQNAMQNALLHPGGAPR